MNNIGDPECGHDGILATDISDHFPIFHIGKNTKKSQVGDTYISSLSTNSRFNRPSLKSTGLKCVCYLAQSALSLFYSKLIKFYDKHIPRKKIKIQYNTRKPWLTPALKQSIRIKNKLYHKLFTIGSSY